MCSNSLKNLTRMMKTSYADTEWTKYPSHFRAFQNKNHLLYFFEPRKMLIIKSKSLEKVRNLGRKRKEELKIFDVDYELSFLILRKLKVKV